MAPQDKDPNPDRGWYYNTRTNEVEHIERSRSVDLLGPYPDEASARHALETARARTRDADAADAKWDND